MAPSVVTAPHPEFEALGLLEFGAIPDGIAAGDAMAKRAPIRTLLAGTVHPGHYLVLVGGGVADVEEAMLAGRGAGGNSLLDEVYLPAVHFAVVAALFDRRAAGDVREAGQDDAMLGDTSLGAATRRAPLHVAQGDALGILETRTVAAILAAADAGLKATPVALAELRLADGLGGKGYLLFSGTVADVEAALAAALGGIGDRAAMPLVRIVARLHAEMEANLTAGARFAQRIGGGG